ncbi:hypothetical protein AXG93_731s1080 [Marchantia polymorpha subsp. ruderalis]|uniref:Uncharacterized protein n=1 Tax=Marchantia polymorpha subsp. ruderalis TaxID=1480154 RepID=A0A176VRC9_MARPO|nr:hypothetical protein AXG93_731s1080 [Marchantia polymorpha subsp. ruderalis]
MLQGLSHPITFIAERPRTSIQHVAIAHMRNLLPSPARHKSILHHGKRGGNPRQTSHVSTVAMEARKDGRGVAGAVPGFSGSEPSMLWRTTASGLWYSSPDQGLCLGNGVSPGPGP